MFRLKSAAPADFDDMENRHCRCRLQQKSATTSDGPMNSNFLLFIIVPRPCSVIFTVIFSSNFVHLSALNASQGIKEAGEEASRWIEGQLGASGSSEKKLQRHLKNRIKNLFKQIHGTTQIVATECQRGSNLQQPGHLEAVQFGYKRRYFQRNQ